MKSGKIEIHSFLFAAAVIKWKKEGVINMKRTLSIALMLCLLLCMLPLTASAAAQPVITEQPTGTDQQIGTPYMLWIDAVSPDGGTLSYQWYQTTVNDISTIKAIIDYDDLYASQEASYVPDPEIGTTYYCCMVTNTLSDGTSDFIYSDLVAVTFRAKEFNLFALKDLTPPAVGEKPDTTVTRVTDDPNNFYGYDVLSVSWSPNDATFRAGVAYTVKIRCRVWENAAPRSDYFGTINGADAVMPSDFDADGEITVSYTYPELKPVQVGKPTITAEPEDVEVKRGEETKLEVTVRAPEDSAKLIYLWFSSETGEGDAYTKDGAETGKWTALTDCRESSMMPDTAKTGTTYYKLVVINEDKDGNTNFTESRAAKVSVVRERRKNGKAMDSSTQAGESEVTTAAGETPKNGGMKPVTILIIALSALAVALAAALTVLLIAKKNRNKKQ
ncbi:MAG: hypothetical protein CW335_00285 [Clostridiales bacterium]|nr:hypothetical protein [Clostridiales bacterium]